MPLYPKQDSFMDENLLQKGGNQPQPMDENGNELQWSQLMGPQECWGPMHALLEHTPLHEQMHVCDAIMLMEME
jgi:hypothetical protein